MISDALAIAFNSSASLFYRFKVNPNFDGQARVLVEEVRECLELGDRIEEVYEIHSSLVDLSLLPKKRSDYNKFMNGRYTVLRTRLILEAADIIFALISLLHVFGVSEGELSEALVSVANKNNAKTNETHHLVNGKITRIA